MPRGDSQSRNHPIFSGTKRFSRLILRQIREGLGPNRRQKSNDTSGSRNDRTSGRMALGRPLGFLRLFLWPLFWSCCPAIETGLGIRQSARFKRAAGGQTSVVLPVCCVYAHSDVSRVHSQQFLYQQHYIGSSLLVRNVGHACSLA